MKYTSTRSGNIKVSFEEALFSSYCSDGGLYVPEFTPKVDKDTLHEWSKLSFVELTQRLTRLFISETEIPTTILNDLIQKALSSFSHPDIIPVKRLSRGLNILELFHGKTLAFKDLGLSCVGQFLQYFLEKRKKRVFVLVVTSGDTGSAAIEGLKDNKWADIIVLLPSKGCSEIQELQMTTVVKENVHVFKVENSIDGDIAIRDISNDKDFVKQHAVMSVNSINWVRIMIQISHYFFGYFQVCTEVGVPVEMIVPTGACGNVAGGMFAHDMGLPVTFVGGVNTNDMVARVVSRGDYSPGPFAITLASAMDIELPYNIERVIYILSGRNFELTRRLQEEFVFNGKTRLPDDLLKQIQAVLRTHMATDARISEVMVRCWREEGYAVCPHTAVALSYFYSQQDSQDEGNDKRPVQLCLATASPAKFPEVMEKTGVPPQSDEKLVGLKEKNRQDKYIPADKNVEAFLKELIISLNK